MVFSNYNNSSYLPLDSDQGVTFYKNENSLFGNAVACPRNTTVNGADPVGTDFQPVAHLSSNGYYGYVPANSMLPKPSVLSTSAVACQQSTPTVNGTAATTVGVLLEQNGGAAAAEVDSLMDCGGASSEMENFHHQQHQHLRKRKEYGEEAAVVNCKRRKTWLEEQQQQQHHQQAAGFAPPMTWNHAPPPQQMDCQDQPMETYPLQSCNLAAVPTNGVGTQLKTLQQPPQFPTAIMTQPPILQPKNRLLGATASPFGSRSFNLPLGASSELSEKKYDAGRSCRELEDLFVSLHGSGFFSTD